MQTKVNFNRGLCFLFILLLPILSQAQKQHELKTEVISVIKTDIALSYEYGITKKISVEVDAKYEFAPRKLFTFSRINNQFADSTYNFEFQYFEFTIGSSYYFFQKEGIDKFYVGVFWINRFLTKDEPAYYSLRNEYYQFVSSYKEQVWSSSRLGLKSGHKWIINNHFVIQPELQIDLDFQNQFSKGLGTLDWTAVIKIGYRF